jgi:hypothetical protein
VTSVTAAELRGTTLGERLAEPQRLLADPTARFVKDHRRTAVAAATIEGRDLYVKRFKPYAWYRRVEWLFAGTPARRCWRRSRELVAAGFRVAPPLAFRETWVGGMPADCYFVTAALDGAEPAGAFWDAKARRSPIRQRAALLRALAAELRRLHDAGFYSRDANADNVLVRVRAEGACEFFLLELENVRSLGRVSERRRVKNLVQLHRPVHGRVRRLDRLRFLRAYRNAPLRTARDWLAALAALDERKEAEYRKRSERHVRT